MMGYIYISVGTLGHLECPTRAESYNLLGRKAKNVVLTVNPSHFLDVLSQTRHN